jgi:hypothetical protein
MRYFFVILTLLSAVMLHQRTTQPQQQQKTSETGKKTNNEIRTSPPVPAPATLPPATPNISNVTVAAPKENAQQTRDQHTVFDNVWGHLATLLNVIATVAIAIFTWLTFGIYQEQLRIAKVNERAWVVPIIGEIVPTPNPKVFQIQVDLRNNGKTPAWITAAGSQGKGATKQKPLPDVPPYTEMGPFSEKGSLLSPTGALPQGFPISQEWIDQVLAGQTTLFLFGYAKYRDVYGDIHITRYCFESKKSQDANHPHPLEFYVGGPNNYTGAD